jgi:drug/metabolite transporter (DMT)-like permease
VILGIVIIVNDLNYSENTDFKTAILYALVSALLAAFFSVINSVLVKETKSAVISLYELFGGFIFIALLFIFSGDIVISKLSINETQIFWLFLLGTICTSFAFLIGVYVMKFIPAYTVNLSVNLEPIYAIVLAILIFKKSEVMTLNFYVGSAIVVGSILLNAFFKKKKKPQKVA